MTALVADLMLEAVQLSATALDEQAQQAFVGLSLFPSSPNTFSEAAAIAVAKCDISTLARLVESGILIAATNYRYSVHRYAIQAGRDFADSALKARFADFFTRYCQAHAAEPHAIGFEAANILASFEYADPCQRAAIAVGMSYLLELRGDYASWERLLQRVDGTAVIDSEFYLQRARCAEKMGLNSQAERYAQQGLKLIDETGRPIEAKLLAVLGHVEMNLGKNDRAREHLVSAVEKSERVASSRTLSQALRSLGIVTTRLGVYGDAENFLRRALITAQEAGDDAAISALWTDLGVILTRTGRLSSALAAHRAALEAAKRIGYSEKEAAALEGCASVHILEGDYDSAQSKLEEAMSIVRRIGHRWYIALILNDLGGLSMLKKEWPKALEYYSEAINSGPHDAPDVRAYSLFGKAQAYAGQKRLEDANNAAHQALVLFDTMPHEAASEVRGWLDQHRVSA